jgi:hypothetical protein
MTLDQRISGQSMSVEPRVSPVSKVKIAIRKLEKIETTAACAEAQ